MMKKIDSVSIIDFPEFYLNKIFNKYEQSIYGDRNIDLLNHFFHYNFEIVDKKSDDGVSELLLITNLTFNNNTFLVGITNSDYNYETGYIINTREISYSETDLDPSEIAKFNKIFTNMDINKSLMHTTHFYPELISVPENDYAILFPKEINNLSKGFFPGMPCCYCDDELTLKNLFDNLKYIDGDFNAIIYKKEK